MAELAGKTSIIFALAGTTPMANNTGVKIEGVDSATLQELAELLEITQFGDTYKRRIAGIFDANVQLSGNYNPADTNGQNIIVAGAALYVGIYPQGTGVAGRQIPVLVESVDWSSEVNGKQAFSCTLAGNGAPAALPLRP